VSRRAEPAEIRRAIGTALGDRAMRDRARLLGEAIRGLDGRARAASVLELSASASR
jgi:UDP:flavonoid glycosyltransferase YjiC (YdhE family)